MFGPGIPALCSSELALKADALIREGCWHPGPIRSQQGSLQGHAAWGWGLFQATYETTLGVCRGVCWGELFPYNHGNLTGRGSGHGGLGHLVRG